MAILVFGVGQLVLPSIANSVARGRIDKYGKVLSLSVSAFPAVELAFGDADTVNVHMANYTAPTSSMAKNLSQAAGVTNMNVQVDTVKSGLFTASNVHMTKRGPEIVATGDISEASLRAALPEIESVKLIGSSGGTLTFQGTFDVFGTITADFTVSPVNGGVNVAAAGLLSSVIDFTIWSDPKVKVVSLSGHQTATGMTLTADAEMGSKADLKPGTIFSP